MGGTHFLYPYTISFNAISTTIHLLIDTRANGFAFITSALACDFANFTSAKFQRLSPSIPVLGFDSKPGRVISHYLRLHLTVNRRKQLSVPFLVTELGSYEIILGRTWLEMCQIKLDVAKRQLLWPKDYTPSKIRSTLPNKHVPRYYMRKLPVGLRGQDQLDTDRRDLAIEIQDQ